MFLAVALATVFAGCGGRGGSSTTTSSSSTPTKRRHPSGRSGGGERLRPPGPPVTAENGARAEQLGSIRVSRAELVDLGYLPDGRTIVCGDDFGVLRSVDSRTGSAAVLFRGGSRIWAVGVRRDGTVAWGDEAGALRLLRPRSKKPRRLNVDGEGVFDLAWAPKGNLLAAGLDSGLVRILGTGAEKLRGLDLTALGVAWSPNGASLAGASYIGAGAIWDVASARLTQRLRYPRNDQGQDMNGIAWLRRPDTVVTASQDGGVRFWNPSSGEITGGLPKQSGWSRALAPSPRADVLADGGSEGTVRLSDPGSLRVLASVRSGPNAIWGLAWSPDGRAVASACADGRIRLVGVPLT